MLPFHLDKLAGRIGPLVYLDLSTAREIVARIDNQTLVAGDPIGDNDTITQVAAQRDTLDFDMTLFVNHCNVGTAHPHRDRVCWNGPQRSAVRRRQCHLSVAAWLKMI